MKQAAASNERPTDNSFDNYYGSIGYYRETLKERENVERRRGKRIQYKTIHRHRGERFSEGSALRYRLQLRV